MQKKTYLHEEKGERDMPRKKILLIDDEEDFITLLAAWVTALCFLKWVARLSRQKSWSVP